MQPGLLAEASLPKLELLKEHPPEALVITHAHSDHIGALPVLKRMYPKLPVFMGEATATITLPMLLDAARVGQRNGSPMFSEPDVINALKAVTLFSVDEPFELGEVEITPRNSGHILGAVGLKLEHERRVALGCGTQRTSIRLRPQPPTLPTFRLYLSLWTR